MKEYRTQDHGVGGKATGSPTTIHTNSLIPLLPVLDYWVQDFDELISGMVCIAERRGAEVMMQGKSL